MYINMCVRLCMCPSACLSSYLIIYPLIDPPSHVPKPLCNSLKENIVACSLKERIVETQRHSVIRQRHVNYRPMVFSAWPVPMTTYAILEPERD